MPIPTFDLTTRRVANPNLEEGFFNSESDPKRQTMFARQQSAQENDSFFVGASQVMPAVLASMIDTFGTSLGILDDEEVTNWLEQNAPDVAQFSRAHAGGVGLAGDIVGSFLPAGIAIKAMRSGSIVAKAIEKSFGPKFAKFVTSTGKSNAQLSQEFIQKGKMVETVNKGVRTVNQTRGAFDPRRAMIRRSVNDVVVESIAADLAIAGSMHSSDFLFPDEMDLVDHLIFFGAANAVFSGGAFAAAKMSFNRNANRILGPKAAAAQNPGGVPITEISGRVNNRGVGITTRGHMLRDVIDERETAQAAGERVVMDVADATRAGLQVGLKDDFVRLGKDSPIDGVTNRINFNKDSGEVETLQKAIELDENSMIGARSLEAFTDVVGDEKEALMVLAQGKLRQNIKDLTRKIQKVQNNPKQTAQSTANIDKWKAQTQAMVDEFQDNQRTLTMVFELDGSMSVAQGRKTMFQDGERKIIKAKDGVSVIDSKKDGLKVAVDANGHVNFAAKNMPDAAKTTKSKTTPGKIVDPFEAATEDLFPQQMPFRAEAIKFADFFTRTAIYDAAQSSLERNLASATKIDIPVPNNAHHTQLDYVSELLESPQATTYASKLKGNNIKPDEITFRSLAGKASEYQQLKHNNAAKLAAGKSDQMLSQEDIVKMLNLPSDTQHPLLQLFEGMMDNNKIIPLEDVVGNLDELKKALHSIVSTTTDDIVNSNIVLRGNMMKLNTRGKPVAFMTRNVERGIDAISREDLLIQNLDLRTKMYRDLLDSKTLFVAPLAQTLKENPELVAAAKHAMPNLLGGLEPTGKVFSQLVQQSFRMRGIPGFAEFDAIANITQKRVEKSIEHLLNNTDDVLKLGGMPDPKTAFNKLLEKQAQGDLVTFFSLRTSLNKGWDIDAVPVKAGSNDGGELYQFALKDSDRNKAIWKQTFNEEMQAGKRLPMPGTGGETLTITQKAWDAAHAMNALSQQNLIEENALRVARNLPSLPKKDFHLPPPNLDGKYVVYVTDNAGTVRTAVSGATEQEANRLAVKEIEIANEQLHLIDQSTIQRYNDARMRSFFEMTDFSRPQSQTGPAKGTAGGSTIRVGEQEFQSMLEQLTRNFVDMGRRTRELVFEPEINFLKLQKAAAGEGDKTQTVFDLMANTILGTKNIDANSIPTRVLTTAENVYDQLMQRTFDAIPAIKESLIASSDAKLKFKEQRAFKATRKALGPEFNPFNDFNDFIEKTTRVKLPQELRKHAGVLNEITTALTIRIADIGMGVVNVISLATTVPPVAKAIQRQLDETVSEQIVRVGAWGTTTPEGIAKISPTRSVMSGIQYMFSPEGREFARRAKAAGYFDQFAAEQVEIFSRTGEKFLPGLIRSFTNKTSLITDKTEIGARAFSFMTFANMGKKLLKLDDEAAMIFAHKQANNVIADFRPVNRPVVFQGAAGMPLGLFTTFMWNYLQRIYQAVETGSRGVLINQVGLQTMLFGAESVPGADLFLQKLSSNMDGDSNLADRLNTAMGQDAADALLNGSVASLTGVSIGPRVAIGLPLQSGAGLDSVPAFRLSKRFASTTGRVIDSIKEEGGFDLNQFQQIIAASNLNKGLSNAIEWGQGFSVDVNDNIIEQNTRNQIGTVSRALGFKPLVADELRQENRRNRSTDRIRGALKERLANSLKSKVRAGRLTSEDVENALESYTMAGGTGENFRRYFVSQTVKGQTSKVDLEIAKAIKASHDQNRIARLLFLSDN